MKKSIIILSIVLAICCLFSSCDDATIYTVTFKGVDGVSEQAVLKGRKATQPALTNQQENSNPGFAFVGWTLDGEDYDFSSPVTRDMILVAKWSYQCTVTFNTGEGGSEVASQSIPYYTSLTKPKDNPTRRGYTFEYWEIEDEEGSYEYNFNGQPVYESFELKAVWEPKNITVNYVAGGTVIKSITNAECGKEIVIEDFPSSTSSLTWAGHAFVGWSFNGTTYHAGEKITVQANDPNNPDSAEEDTVMTLTADWKSDYKVGDVGPSGGVIIYVNNDETATWKYIESAPAPLSGNYCFGYNVISGVATEIGGTTTEIGAGKTNTEIIVNKLGDFACTTATGEGERYTYTDENGEEKYTNIYKGEYAAKACEKYEVKNSNNMTYDDWYLPSSKEFEQLYVAYKSSTASNRKKFVTGSYITSSEVDANYCYTAVATAQPVPNFDYVYFNYRDYSNTDRGGLHSVWPVRYF